MVHATLLTMVAEYSRRQLATRIAVNATSVNEEISRNVFRQAPLNVCHRTLSPITDAEVQLAGERRLFGVRRRLDLRRPVIWIRPFRFFAAFPPHTAVRLCLTGGRLSPKFF